MEILFLFNHEEIEGHEDKGLDVLFETG